MAYVAVIDDDQRILEALENLFLSAGVESRVYSSAEEFLATDTLHSPACIVTDVEMPGMSGVDLLARVRSISPTLPVILMSAHEGLDQRVLSANLDVTHYLVKPFEGEDLVEMVKKELGHRM